MGVLTPIYLFLPWNKVFFGYFVAGAPNFGMIDAKEGRKIY